ncbi:MAG: succinate dehydrogenase, hydrophobic membrane anchor protein [Alphaproteobacteria bacterium]|nr:succinate dehydrogenase, hydrophobic membrane anchor protein [Rhodospirillales bacterium]MCW9045849.1 succinate dehydrogenase, hydrophobic membrane anchor protein [Alphaproteobacteria bacterium]
MRSKLANVRGHGSAKSGSQKWWAERLTALALFPLTIWIIYSILSGVGSDYAAFKEWMSAPGTLALIICYIFALFWHISMGLTMVIEDYIHDKPVEIVLLIAVKFGTFFLGVFSVVSVLKVGVGG